jgi:hypothetical protein
MARSVDKRDIGGRVMKDAKSRRRSRGAVQVEYAFLLLFVMVPTAPILLAGGRVMYKWYTATRSSILSSTP